MNLATNQQTINNAYSRAEAERLRDWQVAQNQGAMTFSAAEAAKNRDWQEYMSNTAHQREVADLRAAGLNPVLSAMGGNGAAVTSGATASGVTSAGAKGETDMSIDGVIAQMMSTLWQTENQMKQTVLNAQLNESIADKQIANAQLLGELNAATSRYVSNNAYGASQYTADKAAESAMDRLSKQLEWDELHPSNLVQAVNAIIGALTGGEETSAVGTLKTFLGNNKLYEGMTDAEIKQQINEAAIKSLWNFTGRNVGSYFGVIHP